MISSAADTLALGKFLRMCGFAGHLSPDHRVCAGELARMNAVLAHRGPDAAALAVDPQRRWGVAHRRLCVLDQAGGGQPMHNPCRDLTLVYNGEIYRHDQLRDELSAAGYAFRSRSDTEVVLAAYAVWGLDFVRRLRGEFALAVLDPRRNRAVLVRDRVGLKPLFLARTAAGLHFASEVKALFQAPAVPRRLDPTGLVAAIAVADTPGATPFAGVEQVKAGHLLEIRLDSLDTVEHRWWDAIGDRRRDLPADPVEQTALVRAEVRQAVAIRRRADVPVGVYLSGGLDSSLVAAEMAADGTPLDAFALAFPEAPEYDEIRYARMVAERHANIRLHEIPVTAAGMLEALPDTVWHLERPFANLHSAAKVIQSRYARRHVACVLTGDGGDEAFCGYPQFWLQHRLQQAGYRHGRLRNEIAAMRTEAARIGGNGYYLADGLGRRVRRRTAFLEETLGFRPCDLATADDHRRRITHALRPAFRCGMTDPVRRQAEALSRLLPEANGHSHALLLQGVHYSAQVPEYIAPIADRSEWAGSVEARPPLFDHRVVELAMGLPTEAKIAGDREKHVLRAAFADLLPPAVAQRRKQAFLAPATPYDSDFGRDLIATHLSPAAVRDAGVWRPGHVRLVRHARRWLPHAAWVNQALTVMLTVQLLHHRLVAGNGL